MLKCGAQNNGLSQVIFKLTSVYYETKFQCIRSNKDKFSYRTFPMGKPMIVYKTMHLTSSTQSDALL